MAAPTPSVELTLDDIVDLLAYERERDSFRSSVKRDRRAERISTDEGITRELQTYNRLISRPGRLSATLFLELTSSPSVRVWLPRFAGVSGLRPSCVPSRDAIDRCEPSIARRRAALA
ncbi:MAG: DUF3501 family protein [Actinomycetota bacterium]|nr:DUF3501 family protein [Actinomycetota bacterium]